MTRTVYLAGPISGLSWTNATTWRRDAADLINKLEMGCIDPTHNITQPDDDTVFDWKEAWKGEGNDRRVFYEDIELGVLQADVVLVGYPTGFQSSGGTAFELGVAYAYGIPIVIWNPTCAEIHPFLDVPSYAWSRDLTQAVKFVGEAAVQTFESAVSAQLRVMRSIMIDRQRKYGPTNILAGGEHGIYTRSMDKMARILETHKECHFTRCDGLDSAPDFDDEGPLDAQRDVANYNGVITPMLRAGVWQLPLLETTFED